MLTIADEGGGGGLKTSEIGWRNMWTAPKMGDWGWSHTYLVPKARRTKSIGHRSLLVLSSIIIFHNFNLFVKTQLALLFRRLTQSPLGFLSTKHDCNLPKKAINQLRWASLKLFQMFTTLLTILIILTILTLLTILLITIYFISLALPWWFA